MNTTNTKDNNSLQRFPLQYESPVSAEEEIANLIVDNFSRRLQEVVLTVNKVGLLPLMKFGKRVK